jgi:penicillin-binding protein 1A
MHGVTGGTAPAEIWHAFMAASLPRLNVQPIPGGTVPAAPARDTIGDLISGAVGDESGAPPPSSPPPAAAPPAAPPPG